MLVRQVLVWFVPRAGCRPRGWWRAGHAVQRGCLGAHGHQREVRREVSHDLSARFTERRPRNLANTTSGGQRRSVWQDLARRSSGGHSRPQPRRSGTRTPAHSVGSSLPLATPAPALLRSSRLIAGLLVGHARSRYLRCRVRPAVGVRGALASPGALPLALGNAAPGRLRRPEGPQSRPADPSTGASYGSAGMTSAAGGLPNTVSGARTSRERQIRHAGHGGLLDSLAVPRVRPAANSVVNRPACVAPSTTRSGALVRRTSGERSIRWLVDAPPPTSLDCRRPTPAHSVIEVVAATGGRFNRLPGGTCQCVTPDRRSARWTEPRVGCSGLCGRRGFTATIWRGNVRRTVAVTDAGSSPRIVTLSCVGAGGAVVDTQAAATRRQSSRPDDRDQQRSTQGCSGRSRSVEPGLRCSTGMKMRCPSTPCCGPSDRSMVRRRGRAGLSRNLGGNSNGKLRGIPLVIPAPCRRLLGDREAEREPWRGLQREVASEPGGARRHQVASPASGSSPGSVVATSRRDRCSDDVRRQESDCQKRSGEAVPGEDGQVVVPR
jgi:hypothetical protein